MRARLFVAAGLAAGMSLGNAALGHADRAPGGVRHGGGGHADRGGHHAGPGEHGRPAHHGPRSGSLSFSLSGAQVPGGGDPVGRGRAMLHLDSEADVVCLRMAWEKLAGAVTAIHIHRAPEGKNGPHQIDLLNDESLAGESNRVEMCVQPAGDHQGEGTGGHHHAQGADGDHHGEPAGADRIQEVLDDPAAFYLNVHSTEHPDGAIRGQLG